MGEGRGGAAGSSWGQMGRSCSVLLGLQLPLAAAHSSDEGSSLTAAVLGQQEVDVTFRGKFLHCLLEDPRETEERRARGNRLGGSLLLNLRKMRVAFQIHIQALKLEGVSEENKDAHLGPVTKQLLWIFTGAVI